jgi:malate dehydrogenase (quinone)
MSTPKIDVALIGAGVMSATLGALIQRLEPDWTIEVFERLDDVALESTDPWNNAGTGHAALCELNYTPETPSGLNITRALAINEQFAQSRAFWSALADDGDLDLDFVSGVPHLTFVNGAKNVEFLRRRHELLTSHQPFRGMEFTTDRAVISDWAPLVMDGREDVGPLAATMHSGGTDINFGLLTRRLFDDMRGRGATVSLNTEVRSITRDGSAWRLTLGGDAKHGQRRARFVFVGAGGGALGLLQSSGISRIRGFGGFPISGRFLRTSNPDVVSRHRVKVYGMAEVGAPPMSVPHLDLRVIDGKEHLMFGPYAGFSPRYLKHGMPLGLVTSLRGHNLGVMAQAGLSNLDLTRYLVGEVVARHSKHFEALRAFAPSAVDEDWEWITAGQRVQVVKRGAAGRGTLEFGTEVVASSDGSIAGLLGASPGASVAVSAMVDVLGRCFPARMGSWGSVLAALTGL